MQHLFLGLTFFIVTGALMVTDSFGGHRERKKGRILYPWSLFLQIAGAVTVVCLAWYEAFLAPPSLGVFLIGCLLFGIGNGLRFTARKTLGRHWSTQVELRPDQSVTSSGIYAFVRHPAYLGLCIEMTGYAIALGSQTAVIATYILFIPTVLIRLLLEDRALEKELPGYAAYRRSTPALLPFLGKTKSS
jgi:protein-S-isoprenylcysteine O-methyltransferase Ste14